MNRGLLFATVLLASCGGKQPPSRPPFELRDVVAPEVAARQARVLALSAASQATTADDELIARADGVLSVLETRDAKLRALGLEDARALGDPAVDLLAKVLRSDESPERRRAAADALAAIATPAAAEVLCGELEHSKEPWVRASCAYALGLAGQDHLVPRMLLRLRYETDGETVAWLAESLAVFGHLAGLDGLRVLRDGGGTQDAAVVASERLETLAQAHKFENGEALYAAWTAGKPDPRFEIPPPSERLALEAWQRIATLHAWDLRQVDDARFVLTRLNTWVVPMLAAALHDSDVYTRVHAAQCLERRGARASGAVDELIAALAEPYLAPAAAAALGAIGEPRAAAGLEKVLSDSKDVDVRAAAAAALGRLAQPSSVEPLRRLFASTEPRDLRQEAASALAALGQGDEVAAFLLESIDAGDPDAAEKALERWLTELAGRGDARATTALAAWQSLAPAPRTIETMDDAAHRHRQRAAIVRELLSTPAAR